MRIFVYEYTCSQNIGSDPLSRALHAEGRAMLSALLEDFSRIKGIETVTLGSDDECQFRELTANSDFSLVIAPETDGILLTRTRWVLEEGGRLLGSLPEAVQLTGDKFELSRHLRAWAIPTPETLPFDSTETELPREFPVVWKPRVGAGSQATFFIRSLDELRDCTEKAHLDGWRGQAIVQPFAAGLPVSVAFLVGPNSCVGLLPAEQLFSEDGRFHYQGGRIPLPPDLVERASTLAHRAVASVDGLHGYVGVDLVLGGAVDGSEDQVIEINPRLTTSYIGLRALAKSNLALVLMRTALGLAAELGWRQEQVRFQADGVVTLV
jgi:predicted ATP-grasp superfamily ATP-dependent carboligase